MLSLSFCLFKCCSICLKYLVYSEALKEIVSFSPHPSSRVSELSHPKERELGVSCFGKLSFLLSEQMIKPGLKITRPDVTNGNADLVNEVVPQIQDKPTIILGVLPVDFTWYTNTALDNMKIHSKGWAW